MLYSNRIDIDLLFCNLLKKRSQVNAIEIYVPRNKYRRI
jgi:hypothetical protein